MNTINLLKKIIMPNSLWMSVGMMLAACAAANVRGEFKPLQAILCLLLALVMQLLANFSHRYYDAKYQYGENIDDGLYRRPGGMANVLALTKEGTTAMFIISLTVGLVVLAFAGWWAVGPGLLAYALIFGSNSGPRPLLRTPWGVIVPFIGFGILGVGTMAQIQICYLNPNPWNWWVMAPWVLGGGGMGFLAVNVQLLHNIAHRQTDEDIDKDTFTVNHGVKPTVWFMVINAVLSVLPMLIFAIYLRAVSAWWSVYPPLLGAVGSLIVCALAYRHPERAVSLSRWQIFCYCIVGLFFFIDSFIIGAPDRLQLEIL